MRIRPLRHITEDMKISLLLTAPIGLMQKNVRLLQRKLGTVEHKFVDYILPKRACKLGFLETVKLLSELFSSKTSLIHKRWKCLKLTKRDSDDYLGFASVVNKNCDDFKLGELSADNFKCPIFAQGLMSAKDEEIRHRVLLKLEKKMAEDCQRIVSVRKDSKTIEESGVAYVRKVKHRSQSYSPVKVRKNMITQNLNTEIYIYIYIYIDIYIYISYTKIHTHKHAERKRETETERKTERMRERDIEID